MRTLILNSASRGGLTGIMALLLALAGSSSVMAQGNQFGAPTIQRPTTSPYLNLFRGSNRALNFGLNYQRRVRPEQDLRQYSAGLNNNIGNVQSDLNRAIGPDGSLLVPGTGHRTSFMNTGGYFSGGGRPPAYSGRSAAPVGRAPFRGR